MYLIFQPLKAGIAFNHRINSQVSDGDEQNTDDIAQHTRGSFAAAPLQRRPPPPFFVAPRVFPFPLHPAAFSPSP